MMENSIDSLISALQWRVEKLYRRGTEKSKYKAYNEALDIIKQLREIVGDDQLHYYTHYTPTRR